MARAPPPAILLANCSHSSRPAPWPLISRSLLRPIGGPEPVEIWIAFWDECWSEGSGITITWFVTVCGMSAGMLRGHVVDWQCDSSNLTRGKRVGDSRPRPSSWEQSSTASAAAAAQNSAAFHRILSTKKSGEILMSLSGRVALITGASQGIGRTCALRLAKDGATVAVAARNQEKLWNELAQPNRHSSAAKQLLSASMSADEEQVKSTQSKPSSPSTAKSTFWSTTPGSPATNWSCA